MPLQSKTDLAGRSSPRFRAECGASRTIRVDVRHQSSGAISRFVLKQPYLVVGRDAKCDVVLPNPDVSRRHAYLQVLPEAVYFCDLHSRSGVRVRGAPRHEGMLGAEEPLEVGPYVVRFRSAPSDSRSEADSAGQFPNPLWPGVELVPQPSAAQLAGNQAFSLRERVTLIGRCDPCHVQLPHDHVAPVHCSLVRTRRALWILDLHANGGVQLDGQPVRCAAIRPQARLSIGPFDLTLRVSRRRDSTDVAARPPTPATEVIPQPGRTGSRDIASPERVGLSGETVLAIVQQFQELQRQLMLHDQQYSQMQAEVLEAIHRTRHEAVMSRLDRLSQQVARLESLCRGGEQPADAAVSGSPDRYDLPRAERRRTATASAATVVRAGQA
jgi:pSer/pThr/pTyr-binding forkhead associated (FHA) protein